VKRALAIALAGAVWAGSVGGASVQTVRSQSGQFVIRGLPQARGVEAKATSAKFRYLPPEPDGHSLRLDPAVLAVSCERVKQAILDLLGLHDQWKGRIAILVHPLRGDREPVWVTSTRFADGWNYTIEMPERMDRHKLLSLLTQVTLMEIANRRARTQTVELPPWLVEGLAAHLLATAGNVLAPHPNAGLAGPQLRSDPLARARQVLREHAPLTLDELNWPAAEHFSDARLEEYRSSAQLFVHELLRTPHGRACLQEMLVMLPEYLNWQTAFLGCFREEFPRLRDLDKWWSVQVVHFTGRDLFSLWPKGESLRQLDEILQTTLQVRVQTNDLPMPSEARLQSVLLDWPFPRQVPLLDLKINLLRALSLRAAPGIRPLVAAYEHELFEYLDRRRNSAGTPRAKTPPPPALRVSLSETIKRLDDLDARRERARLQPGNAGDAVDSALVQSLRR
jgi:hypothetical protein